MGIVSVPVQSGGDRLRNAECEGKLKNPQFVLDMSEDCEETRREEKNYPDRCTTSPMVSDPGIGISRPIPKQRPRRNSRFVGAPPLPELQVVALKRLAALFLF